MSEVKAVKKPEVHYGSLEAAMKEEPDVDLEKMDESKPEVMEFEQPETVSDEQQEALNELDRRKKARALVVPTDVREIVRWLRSVVEPAKLFGEGPAEQRERLRLYIVDKADQGIFFVKPGAPKVETEDREPASNETWYHEGSEALKQARLWLAAYSLPRARDRLAAEKNERENMKAQRAARRQETQHRAQGAAIHSSQVGDTRPLSFCSVSPDNNYLATASWSGLCKLWSLKDSSLLKVFRGHTVDATCVVFHPEATLTLDDSSCCLASCARDGSVKLWSLTADEPIADIEGHSGYRVSRLKFHPSGRFLATCVFDNSWRLWDLEEQDEILHQEGHTRPVYDIAFHPDGSLAITAGMDCYARVWDLRTGRCVIFFQGHQKGILTTDVSPNGYHVATGGEDNAVKVWDLRMRNCLYTIPAHTNIVPQVKFQPQHGNYLLSCSYDKTVKLWAVPSFAPIKILNGHDNKVMSADIASDQSYIVSASFDRTFKLWSVQ